MSAIARPAVVRRVIHHSCPYGIAFDVAAAAQKVSLRIDQACLEAALPQRAAAPIDVINVLNEAPAEVLHHAGEAVWPSRRCQQVHVIGHQHVGIDRAAILACRIKQAVEVEPVVFLGKEGGLPVIAPLDDVLGHVQEV